ncbi:glycosyltransferase [Chryseobacterium rhizoplanae]|uniref:glycosyltransferase family 2 protein n=1 Tax=Chryseobacterium rhizoplanae TaxID=1609531 RepID=UPI001CE30DA3|nr:glycosyltransferase [Chryseobacterium rhizoplanae]UCA61755.1 glycosyltransferase [Chryseobacterium rhizoplanae]
MIKFSILIANYNNGKFFKSCYHSIMMQTYHNWEVIILDDCSTDDSVEVIKSIIGKDSRFKLYENAKNCGVGFTKGRLIELANGSVCGFVDPDDAISPDALFSSVIAYLEDKIVLTYSKFVKCDENLIPINNPSLTKQIRNNDPYFFNCPIQIVNFVTFRKEVYERTLKIDPKLRIAEDQDLYLKLYEFGKFKYIDKVNYYYRMHDGGISQNGNKEKSKEYFAKVIFSTMKRRQLNTINGKAIPSEYQSASEIYDLLKYKESLSYRIKNIIRLWAERFFENI